MLASNQGAGEARRSMQNCRAFPSHWPGLDPRPGILVFRLPRQAHRPPVAAVWGRSRLRPYRASLRRSHDQPSRRTLVLRALGQCSRGDGLMYENAAGLGCVAASNLSPWSFLQDHRRGQRGLRIYPENAAASRKPPLREPPRMRSTAFLASSVLRATGSPRADPSSKQCV
jgi:hypothetical protein